MADPNLFRLNSVPFSWTSCSHFFNGLPYKGVTSVNVKETREVKLVHAAQQDGTPLGITSGIYKVESLSFTLLRDSAAGLLTDLSLLGFGSYGDAEFLYVLKIFEPSLPPSIPTGLAVSGCRVTGIEEKQEMGSDELVTEITCQALFVTRTIGGFPLKLWSTSRSIL